MKPKFILFLTLVMTSCGLRTELPVFDTPQPSGQEELDKVPGKLIGIFESLVDSGQLIVTKDVVIIKNVFNLNVAIAELDSTELNNLKDTVYREEKGTMTVTVSKDSVFQRTLNFDTLYYISDKYAIKKANGYYYFNQKSFHDKWLVRTLRITDKGVLVSKLKTHENISAMDDYSIAEPDSITYKIPTLKELERFLKDEKFKDEWKFVRIEYGLRHKM